MISIKLHLGLVGSLRRIRERKRFYLRTSKTFYTIALDSHLNENLGFEEKQILSEQYNGLGLKPTFADDLIRTKWLVCSKSSYKKGTNPTQANIIDIANSLIEKEQNIHSNEESWAESLPFSFPQNLLKRYNFIDTSVLEYPVKRCWCHGDLTEKNIICGPNVYLIDWEFSHYGALYHDYLRLLLRFIFSNSSITDKTLATSNFREYRETPILWQFINKGHFYRHLLYSLFAHAKVTNIRQAEKVFQPKIESVYQNKNLI